MNLVIFRKSILTMLLGISLLVLGSCKPEVPNFEIEGVDGPHVNIIGGTLFISTVFENLMIDGGARIMVPDYPGSYVEIGPDLQSDGTLMSVSVDMSDIFDGNATSLDPQTLPGGRPLPGTVEGQLPATAFTLEDFHNMTFYIGPEIFGVFFPKKMDLAGSMIGYRYYINGERAGLIYIVGDDANGENGGFLLMLDLGFIQRERESQQF